MTTNNPTAGGVPDNPTNPTMEQFEAMVAAHAAAGASDGNFNVLEGDPAEREEIAQKHDEALLALFDTRPTDPAVLGAWLRWMLDDDKIADERGVIAHVAAQLERIGALSRRYAGLEDAARSICAGYALLDQYSAELSPATLTPTADELDRDTMRLGWLIDSMGPNVRALAEAVWGDARFVDDIHPCREPESDGSAK